MLNWYFLNIYYFRNIIYKVELFLNILVKNFKNINEMCEIVLPLFQDVQENRTQNNTEGNKNLSERRRQWIKISSNVTHYVRTSIFYEENSDWFPHNHSDCIQSASATRAISSTSPVGCACKQSRKHKSRRGND